MWHSRSAVHTYKLPRGGPPAFQHRVEDSAVFPQHTDARITSKEEAEGSWERAGPVCTRICMAEAYKMTRRPYLYIICWTYNKLCPKGKGEPYQKRRIAAPAVPQHKQLCNKVTHVHKYGC
ncbi:hypothetical protein NDU88_001178 [Pleurodeles waltl]|uniref:Uncharacterized protein n=1 Tax=Pleurodeles waltl TaxID=8319 RepID=A0AAV7NA16_PLEWA|nr:hypothetical protein NDU88_001178 [Pleurodeles waltl]